MRQHQTPRTPTKPTVKRNLFGSNKDTEDWLQKQLNIIDERNKMLSEIFNFDFEEGKPMEGRFSWSKCK